MSNIAHRSAGDRVHVAGNLQCMTLPQLGEPPSVKRCMVPWLYTFKHSNHSYLHEILDKHYIAGKDNLEYKTGEMQSHPG